MKLFIVIGIFFIGSVAAMPEDDQEILVNQMNGAREKFAVLLPVANMNEIVSFFLLLLCNSMPMNGFRSTTHLSKGAFHRAPLHGMKGKTIEYCT